MTETVPKQREKQQTAKYSELIAITEEAVNGAQEVLQRTRNVKGQGLITELAIGELRKEIEHYCQNWGRG